MCKKSEHIAKDCLVNKEHAAAKAETKEKATAHSAAVSHSKGKQNVMNGLVGEHALPFILDSGAGIPVILEECVARSELTGEHIHVLDVNGGEVRWPVAMVNLEVGCIKGLHRVAVAPLENLNGHALMAIDFDDPVHFQLLVNCKNGMYKRVCTVQTRGEVEVETEMLERERVFHMSSPSGRKNNNNNIKKVESSDGMIQSDREVPEDKSRGVEQTLGSQVED